MNKILTREETNVLKAIAILTVILTHANGYAHAFVNIPILKNGTITGMFCQAGMCTFLILSGYGLYASFIKSGLNGFWDKKFNKILMPALLIQCAYYFIKVVYNYVLYRTIDKSWGFLFGDLLCFNQNNAIDGSIWYLSYLFFCYISFYFFFKYIKNTKISVCALTVFMVACLPIMYVLWDNSFYCISSFILGVILSYFINSKKVSLSITVKAILLVIFIAVGVSYYFYFRKSVLLDNIASNMSAFAFIILFSFIKCDKLKVLPFIGKHSFSLYLLQGKVIFGLFPYEKYSDNMKFVSFLILFVVNILVAVFYDKFIGWLNSKSEQI